MKTKCRLSTFDYAYLALDTFKGNDVMPELLMKKSSSNCGPWILAQKHSGLHLCIVRSIFWAVRLPSQSVRLPIGILVEIEDF